MKPNGLNNKTLTPAKTTGTKTPPPAKTTGNQKTTIDSPQTKSKMEPNGLDNKTPPLTTNTNPSNIKSDVNNTLFDVTEMIFMNFNFDVLTAQYDTPKYFYLKRAIKVAQTKTREELDELLKTEEFKPHAKGGSHNSQKPHTYSRPRQKMTILKPKNAHPTLPFWRRKTKKVNARKTIKHRKRYHKYTHKNEHKKHYFSRKRRN